MNIQFVGLLMVVVPIILILILYLIGVVKTVGYGFFFQKLFAACFGVIVTVYFYVAMTLMFGKQEIG